MLFTDCTGTSQHELRQLAVYTSVSLRGIYAKVGRQVSTSGKGKGEDASESQRESNTSACLECYTGGSTSAWRFFPTSSRLRLRPSLIFRFSVGLFLHMNAGIAELLLHFSMY